MKLKLNGIVGSLSRIAQLVLITGITVTGNAFAFPIFVSNAPASDLSLTLETIKSAKKSLHVNIYEMTSQDIANALLDRINAGIHVEILMEGQPVGKRSPESHEIQTKLIQAMKNRAGSNSHFFEMTSKVKNGRRRFHFDHGKYIVTDNKELLIGSENYSPSGNPVATAAGNRGWEVLIQEQGIVDRFLAMYKKDSDSTQSDIIDWCSTNQAAVPESNSNGDASSEDDNDARLALTGPSLDRAGPVNSYPQAMDASAVYEITSPDTSLTGLVKLLNEAKSEIDLQLMTFDSKWGGPGKSSPLFSAVVDAARRGVKVRVLLNDENVFLRPGAHVDPNRVTKNRVTVGLLNELATREKLNLSAMIADLKKMQVTYIHNKGALVDQDKTLISSINWNENSVEMNRETAVVVVSPEVHAYYYNLFNRDWSVSLASGMLH